ncbi:MAG: carboxypeptidase regulatory-like domain-containing protein, partial [Ignavibacteriae bacterium]|nr:carboxypeptidase regulatory-like domain-containing protein [Ignavibacteriota bacterium]
MSNKIILLVMLLIFGCNENVVDNNRDDNQIISGRVIDNYFQKGLPGAVIKLSPGDYSTTSDSLGFFNFEKIPIGKYMVVTEAINFLADSREIDLTKESNDSLKIFLKREMEHFYKLNFKVYEGYSWLYSYDIEEPFVKIYIETEEVFGCSNYKIITKNKITQNIVDIAFEEISDTGVCATSIGPATIDIPLKILEGKYTLNIKQQDVVDKYFVTVSDTSILIEPNGVNLISQSKYSIFWRYPKKSFALIAGATEATKEIYYNFVKMISDSTNVYEITLPDYGQLCYPRNTQGLYVEFPSKFYKYKNEEEFDKIGSMLIKYSKENI